MSPANPLPPALPPGATAAPVPGKKALNGCLIAAIIGALLFIGIVVIAVLAGIALPALNSARKKAQHAQARTLAISIVNSCKGYYAEYSRYPLPGDASGGGPSPLRTDGVLTGTLLGTNADRNPKRISFLPELAPAAVGHGPGLLVQDDAHGGVATIVDPWGEEFYVLLDADSDGTIPNPDSGPGKPSVLYQGVIVYSAGPDKDPNTWEDNPRSWDSGFPPVIPPATPVPASNPLPPPPPPSPEPPR